MYTREQLHVYMFQRLEAIFSYYINLNYNSSTHTNKKQIRSQCRNRNFMTKSFLNFAKLIHVSAYDSTYKRLSDLRK